MPKIERGPLAAMLCDPGYHGHGLGRALASATRVIVKSKVSGRLPVVDSQMALFPVSENDLALLQRLYSDPLVGGEHEWHGWQDTRWLRREWEENGLLGEDCAAPYSGRPMA